MTPIPSGQRFFFIVICAAALLVAVLGLFLPAYLASIFSWLELPPLHARFVGAIYAFGAVFMAGCLAARQQAEVRGAVQLIGVWTGMLFIISLLNLGAFDFSRLPVWIWFASYILYPLIAIWMSVRKPPQASTEGLAGARLTVPAKGFLLAQGILFSLLAVLLFLAPARMQALWPWNVSPILAQMYSGPLLAYGLGSVLFSRQDTWQGVRAILPGMLVFSAATLVASILHIGLFSFGQLADLLWFGWFIAASIILAFLTFRAVQPDTSVKMDPGSRQQAGD